MLGKSFPLAHGFVMAGPEFREVSSCISKRVRRYDCFGADTILQHWHLTDRAARIVEPMASGSSSKEMTQVFAILPPTDVTRLKRAKIKFGARNRPSRITQATGPVHG